MKALPSALAAVVLALGATLAEADPAAGEREISLLIESKSMAEALDEWAKQTGYMIVVPNYQLAETLPAPPVKGNLNPWAALDKLLEGSPFTWLLLKQRTVLVRERVLAVPAPGSPDAKDTKPAPSAAPRRFGRARDRPQAVSVRPEEVVVTAQRHEQRIQDVPIATTVLTGASLDSFTAGGVSQALTLVPGIKVTQEGVLAGGNPQLSVRGVAASGATFNGSSPVAYYLDCVPFGLVKTAVVPDSNPYDLQRVEVLRGPQGTLYGASALNGVVRVLTRDADLDYLELKTRAAISSTQEGGDNYRVDAALNVPLVPGKLGVRAILGYNTLSGWIDSPTTNDSNDAQLRNARLKVNAQPTDRLSLGLSAWLAREDFGAPSISNDANRYPGVLPQPMSTDYDVFGLKVGYDFAFATLSSMTHHIDYSTRGRLDASPFNVTDTLLTRLDSAVLSQEIALNSTDGGAWRWSAGAFYRRAEDRLLQASQQLLPAGQPVDYTDRSESYALFGEITRVVADGKLEVTAGLRYFEDEVTQIENVPQPPAAPTDPLLPPDRRNFDALSPRFVLAWHPGDDSTVYASYAEGFRSGFNQNSNIIRAAPAFRPVRQDSLSNYEIGAKANVADGLLSFDTSLYYIDWRNVQQTVFAELPPGSGESFSAVVNGESASGIGIDVAVSASPLEGVELGVTFSWNDLGLDGPVEQGGVRLFEKRDRLNFSAEYTAGAVFDYQFPLGGSALRARFTTSANYSSAQTTRELRGPIFSVNRGDSILNVNGGLSIESPDRWTATLFVDNASNENGAPVRYAVDFWSARVRPRTIGLQFEYSFRAKL